jgi:hypothetical protein
MKGIRGTEALVHYFIEQTRALRRPRSDGCFLTPEQEDLYLNYNNLDNVCRRREEAEQDEDESIEETPVYEYGYKYLHTQPIDWAAKRSTRIEA